jgi:N12 class adenine-specific DNA methylase/predicted RNA methylase
LLSADDYAAARRSTQDAHFTPQTVVEAIYRGVEQFGFAGGKVLDPALGSGHFIGLMPEALRSASKVTGIELDPSTAKIAKHLYPTSTVIAKGFEDVTIPAGYFDLVVGNPPFGNQSVYDQHHPDLSDFSIHNYFIAKSLDTLRDGGVLAVVVSHYFLDAKNPAAREHIAQQAEFLGAIRLPDNAFKKNALTEVTTDIVFFQKRAVRRAQELDWVKVNSVADPKTGEPFALNEYFVAQPSMMLGTMMLSGGNYAGGNQPRLEAHEGLELEAALNEQIARLPREIYRQGVDAGQAPATPDQNIDVPDDTKIGAYFLSQDRVARRLPDVLDERQFEWATFKNDRAPDRVKGMLRVSTALRALMRAEQSDSADEVALARLRRELNSTYDSFTRKHGHLSSQANRLVMAEDPEYPLLHALERDYDKGVSKETAKKQGVPAREPSAIKASIFTQRVISPRRAVTRVDTAKDALVVCMNERGLIDIARMVALTGKPESALLRELEGLIFKNPATDAYETAERYLGGDVKRKLRIAQDAAETTSAYGANVDALERVQPADIEPVDIAIQLGSTWVPADVVSTFVTHVIGDVHRNISYQPSIGKWIAKIGRGDQTTMTATWGTPDAPANELIEALLTNRSIEIRDRVGTDAQNNPIYHLNAEKTAAAAQKGDELKQAFLDWVWEDKERRDRLARLYNDTFNVLVPTRYDGAHLTLPGASINVTPRPHQKDAIWRALQDGSALFDHRVGAGKTIVCIGTAMEGRRMGLIKKPMIVVPNHLTIQWKDAFYELYPNANILVAEKADFAKENRQRLFARIATGDWDAVIVGHSSFKKIGVPQETLNAVLNEQIDDLTEAVIKMREQNGDRLTIKEMEKARDRMKAKLERAAQTGSKDDAVGFDELGVDALLVDEAHTYKNLFINTSLSRVAGLGNLAGSDQAFDMFVKVRYLQKKNDGRGVYFATGTPISNTIAEMYTLQRYMQYDELRQRQIAHFDAWASTFGQVVTGWELDATGVNYKLNSRFAKFQNVPELVAMYRSFADVITQEDLNRQAEAAGKRFPVPKIRGGKPRNVILERSPEQARFMGVQEPLIDEDGKPVLRVDGTPVKRWTPGSIIDRMENLPDDPSIDNPLKITNDARKAGLDFRLIDDRAADFAGSKVSSVVDDTFDTWRAWEPKRGTQMIFCDLSTPKPSNARTPSLADNATQIEAADDDIEQEAISMDELIASRGRFSVYNEIKSRLVQLGVPEHEIAFIHDAKTDAQKAKLFDQMNRGDVRILLGSTSKMGAGTNAQRRLVALRHIDAPWRPSDLEQREGRILRQGNQFYEEDPEGFEVDIVRYATKQTYDSRMWQTIEYKAAGIEQFRRGDSLQRTIEDIAGEAANAAEMKAAATGNPLIFMQVQLSAELKKLEAIQANHNRNRHALQSRVRWLEQADSRGNTAVAAFTKDIARRDSVAGPSAIEVGTRRYSLEEKDALMSRVMLCMKRAIDAQPRFLTDRAVHIEVGKFKGFEVEVYCKKDELQFVLKGEYTYQPDNLAYAKDDKFSASGFLQRLDNFASELEDRVAAAESARAREKVELEKARAELGKGFPQQVKLEQLRKDVGEVMVELKRMQSDENYVSSWKPSSTDAPTNDATRVHDVTLASPEEQEQALKQLTQRLNCSPSEPDRANGIYVGKVLGATHWSVLQEVGRGQVVSHRLRDFTTTPATMGAGEHLHVTYRAGAAECKRMERSATAMEH